MDGVNQPVLNHQPGSGRAGQLPLDSSEGDNDGGGDRHDDSCAIADNAEEQTAEGEGAASTHRMASPREIRESL